MDLVSHHPCGNRVMGAAHTFRPILPHVQDGLVSPSSCILFRLIPIYVQKMFDVTTEQETMNVPFERVGGRGKVAVKLGD
jgi:hypothetical protein